MVAKWLANVWWPLDSIAISVFCNFGWVWQILNEKQIQIPIWWWGEVQPCVIHNVYWPLHGNEKWMLRIRKGQREGNEEVRGELGATLGPILRTRDCPRCANVSIIIQFFTLFHVLKLHWRMVTVSSFCILWQPRQIHPHLRSASTYSSFTSNDLKHYDHWPPTHHRFGKFHLIFPVLEIENTADYCQIH